MRMAILAGLVLTAMATYGSLLGALAGLSVQARVPHPPTVTLSLAAVPTLAAAQPAAAQPGAATGGSSNTAPAREAQATAAGQASAQPQANGAHDVVLTPPNVSETFTTAAVPGKPTSANVVDMMVRELRAAHPELSVALDQTIAGAIVERATAWHLDPWLVYSVIEVESSFNHLLIGSAGEIGLMQVLPSTAAPVAANVFNIRNFDPKLLFDPAWNIRIGTAYLAFRIREFGSTAMGLTAYNAGDGVTQPNDYARRVLAVYDSVK